MKQLKKTLLTLALLITAVTGAWATDYTTLAVGDVIKVGDTFTPTAECAFNDNGVHSGETYTLMRADVDDGYNVTEKTDGAYYVFKYDTFTYPYIHFEKAFAVTAISDGLEVTNIETIKGTLFYTLALHESAASSGPKVTWTAASKTGQFTMPGGNVTLEPDYYPQATAAEGAVTAATDVKATTDAPLVTIDKTKLTGAKKLMYYVSTDATAPAYDAEGWTEVLPTAENYTEAANLNVWYYPVGTDEGTDGATATYSDGDICATALTVTLGAAPTYAVTFADDLTEPTLWTASPNAGVVKGTEVTVTYTGAKKVLGVKAEKKTAPASTPLDNTTTAWTAGKYAVPAGGLTYSDAITVSGDVTLTLTDGETLTLNKGISLAEGATLTVEGTGTMNVNGTNNSTASTVASSTGTLILTSGTLTAKGGNGQDATDPEQTGASGGAAINGSVTVNGGSLTATGGNGGNCIGATIGYDSYAGAGGAAISGDVTITDGAVAATGGNGGSIGASNFGMGVHGGAGGAAIGGNATLTGGTLTATQGANGTGSLGDSSVGTGGKAVAGTVTDNRN